MPDMRLQRSCLRPDPALRATLSRGFPPEIIALVKRDRVCCVGIRRVASCAKAGSRVVGRSRAPGGEFAGGRRLLQATLQNSTPGLTKSLEPDLPIIIHY